MCLKICRSNEIFTIILMTLSWFTKVLAYWDEIISQMAEISYHFHLRSLVMRKLATPSLPCPWGWEGHQRKEGKCEIVHLCYVVNELNTWHFSRKIKYGNEIMDELGPFHVFNIRSSVEIIFLILIFYGDIG